MKKFLVGFMLGLLITTSGVALAAQSVRVYVDGNEVISDVPAQIIDGRTVLPVRAVCEAMGASVSWDEVSNSVYITSKNYVSAPVVVPDVPVDVDISVPITPAPIDISVTSEVYGAPPIQGTNTVEIIQMRVNNGVAVFATHLIKGDFDVINNDDILHDDILHDDMRKNRLWLEPEGIPVYSNLTAAETWVQGLNIPYAVEVLDYEAYKIKSQGVIYQSRTEALEHLLYDKVPHSLR